MCGRFTLTPSAQVLMDELGLLWIPEDYRPRFNVAPGQLILAARDGDQGRKGAMLKWGLVPPWAKDPSIGSRMINARSETVAEKPSFRRAFDRRRCIIPADGFYEWRKDGKVKIPMLFRLRGGRPFAFAGLWEAWRPRSGKGETLFTCTILTTAANELVQPVHDRMPVILPKEAIDLWLDRDVPGEGVRGLLAPYPAEEMEAYEVSPRVNSVKNDDPLCIEPV
ncbi:MAG TPA: SOS response-associated peptidase [Limnochordia bacterium]|nr:SOS response-associated peptidase [Limnochordia bacterium]